jgi:hypothetical protein
MTEQQTDEAIAAALFDARAMFGLAALSSTVQERIAPYGVEALIECTLAEQAACVDAALRACFYEVVLQNIGKRVAAQINDTALCV